MEAAQHHLLDLSYLTEEERERLVAVIKADEELRIRDRIRLGTIRQEIERQRSHQVQLDGLSQCSYCESRLGRFFNSGAHCPRCGHKVCKRCRVIQDPPSPKFICSVCERQRLLDLQSNDYRIGTTLSAPRQLPGNHRRSPSPNPQQLEQDLEIDHLYGSELLRKSLMATATPSNSRSSSPVPKKKPHPSVPVTRPSLSGSISGSVVSSSSIVVRYTDREESEDERSVKSLTPGRDEEEMAVHPAKKISLDELPEMEEEGEEEEKEMGRPDFKKYPSGQGFGSSLVPSGSIGSITSIYSASVGKGDYDITGEVELGVWFKDRQLFVRVVKARGLAAAKKGGVSDPYVKTYLLPDRGKHSKRKTSVQRKTVNPVFNEILKTKIEQGELTSRTLWLSVWDWDRFGRNQFLGEVHLPLSSLELTDSRDHWYTLQDKDETNLHDEFYKGKLRLGLMYSPKARMKSSNQNTTRTIGTLYIAIHQAEDLPVMDQHGLTDATVKMYLLPNQSSSSKRKTKVIKNSLSPVWSEQFTYENICLEDLTAGRVLEVTVWDYDRRGSNDFIGGLRLGPHPDSSKLKVKDWMDSIGDEVSHWEKMLERPGEWAEQWHTLRPTMQSLSKYHAPLSPNPRKKELSPVQELSPTHEIEESTTPPVVEGFSFSLPPTPKRSLNSPPSILSPTGGGAFKRATPVAADELLLDEEEEEEEEEEEREERGGDVPTQTTPTSSEASPIPEVVVTPEPEQKIPLGTLREQFGSTASLYNKGDYDIIGEVLVGVYYKSNQLHVHVERARGLAAADSNGYSDPYVKTYLLPDKAKHTKQKTSVKKKTLDPTYNETLKYKQPEAELTSRTLWLSVWDWDRFGKNRFLGEVRLPLSSLDLKDTTDQWYQLKDKSEGGQISLLSSSIKRHQQKEDKQKHVSKQDPSLAASAVAKPPVCEDKETTTSDTKHEPVNVDLPLAKEAAENEKVEKCEREEESVHAPVVVATGVSVVATGASMDREDVTMETQSSSQLKHDSPTKHAAESSEPVEEPVPPKISLTEVHHDYQGLPHKQVSSLARLKHSERSSVTGSVSSFGSMTSIYSEAGGKGDYDITGEVLVGVYYKSNQLHVHVERARGLAAADSNGYSDPYVKTYLLPDKAKHTKQKTSVKKKTLDPTYNETLKYKVSKSELTSRTLWLSVWDWDRFGRNQFLGEVHLPLSSLDLTVSSSQWYSLQDKDESSSGGVDAFYRGEVKVGLKYQPIDGKKTKGSLLVDIKEARELPAMDGDSTDSAVKLHLLPNRKTSGKRKTGVLKNNLNPVWEERFTYEEVSLEELSRERVLEVSVWNYNKSGNTFIGGLRLGPAPGSAHKHKDWMDSIGDEVSHWEDMLSRPGEWAEQWHTLRTTLNPRNVDLKMSSPAPPPVSHPLSPPVEKEQTAFSPVSLADTFKKVTPPTLVEEKDTEGQVHRTFDQPPSKESPKKQKQTAKDEPSLTASSTAELPVAGQKQVPSPIPAVIAKSTVVAEKQELKPSSLTNEIKKMAPPLAPPLAPPTKASSVVEKEDQVHGTVEHHPSNESPKRQKPAEKERPSSSAAVVRTTTAAEEVGGARTTKPVFSSSVRNRPSAPPTLTSPSILTSPPTREVRKEEVSLVNLPKEDSQEARVLKTNSPKQDRHTDKEETPVITVESEITPPKATSTPIGKGLDLSEVSAYTQESPGSEAHGHQATPPRPKAAGLLGLKQAGSITSFGSMTSIYSEAGGKGDYDITGEVLVGVYYKSNQLHVHVERARGLAAADSNGYSDPYVKTYLLPDKAKHTKQKTSVKKKTLDPTYNETLKYKYSESELTSRTLWLSVWDWDRFGRNLFLGEVRLPLSSLDLKDSTGQWYQLQDKDEDTGADETYKGQLKLSMMFSPDAHSKKSKGQGTLNIAVEQAKDFQEPADSFVKLYLLPDKSSSGKRKTKIVKSSLKPSWEEKFTFDKVKLDDLSRDRVLEVTVWNFHKRSGNVFIGGLRLGPAPGSAHKHKDWMDSIGDEVSHWEDMLSRPGEWAEQWHTLRTTMNPRDILLH